MIVEFDSVHCLHKCLGYRTKGKVAKSLKEQHALHGLIFLVRKLDRQCETSNLFFQITL